MGRAAFATNFKVTSFLQTWKLNVNFPTSIRDKHKYMSGADISSISAYTRSIAVLGYVWSDYPRPRSALKSTWGNRNGETGISHWTMLFLGGGSHRRKPKTRRSSFCRFGVFDRVSGTAHVKSHIISVTNSINFRLDIYFPHTHTLYNIIIRALRAGFTSGNMCSISSSN